MCVSKNINKYKWIFLEISTKTNAEIVKSFIEKYELTSKRKRPLLDNSAKEIWHAQVMFINQLNTNKSFFMFNIIIIVKTTNGVGKRDWF